MNNSNDEDENDKEDEDDGVELDAAEGDDEGEKLNTQRKKTSKNKKITSGEEGDDNEDGTTPKVGDDASSSKTSKASNTSKTSKTSSSSPPPPPPPISTTSATSSSHQNVTSPLACFNKKVTFEREEELRAMSARLLDKNGNKISLDLVLLWPCDVLSVKSKIAAQAHLGTTDFPLILAGKGSLKDGELFPEVRIPQCA
jgi:hypothetical protein